MSDEHPGPALNRTTIHDVAQALGVSKSTVSAALNGTGKLKEETRERVRETADRLGYRPNRAALAFRSGRTGSIALALPYSSGSSVEMLDLEIYMTLARAAALATFEFGSSLILTPSTQDDEYWRGLGADGVIICDPDRLDPRIDLLERIGVPTVTIERDPGRPDWPYSVVAEHATGMTRLLEHLESQGARRIALVATQTTWSWAEESLLGYRAWFEERGLPQQVLLVPLTRGRDELYSQVMQMLSSGYEPDAIVVMAEQYRDIVLQACRDKGLRIPDDILIALGTDSTAAAMHHPSLTAMDLQPEAQARRAVELLMSRIAGNPIERAITYESVLNVRESTVRTPAT